MRAFEGLVRPVVAYAARRALVGRPRRRGHLDQGRFTRDDVARVLDAAWSEFHEVAGTLPDQPTIGARMNVRLAALTVAAYKALRAEHVARDDAVELVGDITWQVYGPANRLIGFGTAAIGRDPDARMRRRVRLLMEHFPFNPPGYEVEWGSHPHGQTFDVLRCPVAETFHQLLDRDEAVELCEGTWCNQDWAQAELWGGHLERTTTLVAGADRCNFRFLTGPTPQGAADP